MRLEFTCLTLIITSILIILSYYINPVFYYAFVLWLPLMLLGYYDFFQTKHTIRRNFPIVGHFRYLLESIRPEINQYFIESNSDGSPFSRESRSLVYQRAKLQLDSLPFGTQHNVYEKGHEYLNHSLTTTKISTDSLRVTIGGPQCKQPYSSSIFNISAMSYGSLSKRAIESLNAGAQMGQFYHNSGEGGLSPYHLNPGGDLVWQIGTGYFGARTADGGFSEEKFKERSALGNVKMIELKLSQGAKPGHGGILPGKKVTEEIAEIRGVEPFKTVDSPPYHKEFNTPVGLMEFIGRLRELSDGKPVGFKLCIGKRREFVSICKAMMKLEIYPDFITVDGSEGGTGAAPLEFANNMGMPAAEAVVFVHNCLVGFGLRDKIKVIAAGKVTSGFGLIKFISIGADVVNSGRAFMLSLGCIQALRCHNNKCPTGVATNNPSLVGGLDVQDKTYRVYNYHKETLDSVADLMGAMGLKSTDDLKPWHILKRVGLNQIHHYGQIYDYIEAGSLLNGSTPQSYERIIRASSPDTFDPPSDAFADENA